MDIYSLIPELFRMKARNAFRNYIEYIQFPYFRNLEKDTRINFDFPLTVFVGQNGSGKSSTLHALYGAPKRNTPLSFGSPQLLIPFTRFLLVAIVTVFFYVYKNNTGYPLEV